jgi:DNA-binding NtrC family response regulator
MADGIQYSQADRSALLGKKAGTKPIVKVADGSFREDLFCRLKGMILRTPALVERREDIPVLAALSLKRALTKKRVRLAPDAINRLTAQAWPGNVRKLHSLLECAAALAAPSTESGVQLDLDLLAFAVGAAPAPSSARRSTLDEEMPHWKRG